MERRRYLALAGAALGGAFAGCSSSEDEPEGEAEPTPTATATAIATDTPTETATPTDTETETPTETAEPAVFEVAASLPSEVEIGEEFTLELTVTNTGEQEGTFEATIDGRTASEDRFTEITDVSSTVDGGEEVTLETESMSFDYLTTLTFQVREYDIQQNVTVVSRRISRGETYETPWQIAIRVDRIELNDTYTWEGSSGQVYEEPASEGNQWAFLWVWTKNNSGSSEDTPFKGDFGLLADNRQYDYEIIYKEENRYESGDVQPGVVRDGWIAFEIPENLTVGDITTVWSRSTYDGDLSVYWQP